MGELIVLFGFELVLLELNNMYKDGCIDENEYNKLVNELNSFK